MITRFIVQSYILSMAIKSLMFFVVFTNIFEKEYQIEEFRQLFDDYYRGLCNPQGIMKIFVRLQVHCSLSSSYFAVTFVCALFYF